MTPHVRDARSRVGHELTAPPQTPDRNSLQKGGRSAIVSGGRGGLPGTRVSRNAAAAERRVSVEINGAVLDSLVLCVAWRQPRFAKRLKASTRDCTSGHVTLAGAWRNGGGGGG